jgi:hypothetical protein
VKRSACSRTRRCAEPLKHHGHGSAEADGNRTRQTEILGLVGVEDRAAHQDEYASAGDPSCGYFARHGSPDMSLLKSLKRLVTVPNGFDG